MVSFDARQRTVNIIASANLRTYFVAKEYACIRTLYEDLKDLGYQECAHTIPYTVAPRARFPTGLIASEEDLVALHYDGYANIDLCSGCQHQHLCGHTTMEARQSRLDYIRPYLQARKDRLATSTTYRHNLVWDDLQIDDVDLRKVEEEITRLSGDGDYPDQTDRAQMVMEKYCLLEDTTTPLGVRMALASMLAALRNWVHIDRIDRCVAAIWKDLDEPTKTKVTVALNVLR